MVQALTITEFFGDPKGPIGMLIGGVVIALTVAGFFLPYYELPSKVQHNTQKIKELKQQQENFKLRFKQIEGRLESLNDNQLLLVCNSPNIGHQYKQSRDCAKRYPGSE